MWFRVDDSFLTHPKTEGICNDTLAMWLRAGDWSAWQLTDGRVPRSLLWLFAGNAADAEGTARDLVDRRLWENNGGDGWQFHDWADWNPTRAQVTARRKADAERRRRWLEKRNKPPDEVITP